MVLSVPLDGTRTIARSAHCGCWAQSSARSCSGETSTWASCIRTGGVSTHEHSATTAFPRGYNTPHDQGGRAMAEQTDTSKGWCCDGRTWTEHAHEDGQCCQPEGTQ